MPAVKEQAQDRQPILPYQAILDLVARTQGGDTPARDRLFMLFEPLVRGAVAAYRDPALCEELLGEAYLVLNDRLRRFDSERGVNLFTYLVRTVPPDLRSRARTYLKHGRWEVREPTTPAARDADPQDSGETGEEALDRLALARLDSRAAWDSVERLALARIAVDEAIQPLPQREREVFVLTWKGIGIAEVAAALRISRDAAYKALQRARTRLQAAMKTAVEEDVQDRGRDGTITG